MEQETLTKILRALGDPTRLSIFDALMEGVHCNCEIAAQTGLSLSLISHHLHVLQQVGLIEGERDHNDARWIYYFVNQATLNQVNDSLNQLLSVSRIMPRQPACKPTQTCDQC